jgi:undecaprenyl-diphosphatase
LNPFEAEILDLLQTVVLSIVQGLTEFLPISSSAHLILAPRLLAWPDQGLAFDVAVHVGTLLAVVGYFRHEIVTLAGDWSRSLIERRSVGESRLAWAVLLGTVPVGLVGLVSGDFIEQYLRSPLVIATTTIVFGGLLWWADRRSARSRDEHALAWSDVALIGCAQALALIPGTSRSGITITAGLAAGLTRAAAARFSFLLSIPVIVLAGGLETLDLLRADAPAPWLDLVLGAVLSAASAYICIHVFLKLLERVGMLPFVIYRLALGAFLLWVFWP